MKTGKPHPGIQFTKMIIRPINGPDNSFNPSKISKADA